MTQEPRPVTATGWALAGDPYTTPRLVRMVLAIEAEAREQGAADEHALADRLAAALQNLYRNPHFESHFIEALAALAAYRAARAADDAGQER